MRATKIAAGAAVAAFAVSPVLIQPAASAAAGPAGSTAAATDGNSNERELEIIRKGPAERELEIIRKKPAERELEIIRKKPHTRTVTVGVKSGRELEIIRGFGGPNTELEIVRVKRG